MSKPVTRFCTNRWATLGVVEKVGEIHSIGWFQVGGNIWDTVQPSYHFAIKAQAEEHVRKMAIKKLKVLEKQKKKIETILEGILKVQE